MAARQLRQRLEVGGQTAEAGGALEAALVHVERAVELELDGMQARGRVAVMLGDEAAGIGLVAAHRVALLRAASISITSDTTATQLVP